MTAKRVPDSLRIRNPRYPSYQGNGEHMNTGTIEGIASAVCGIAGLACALTGASPWITGLSALAAGAFGLAAGLRR
jgi:hypothetical protein